MSIQESGEMYLETILILSKSGKGVRSIDVGEYMGYSKPSVSRAVGVLKSAGYITVAADGELQLTDEGKCVAEKIYERHNVLTNILLELGVPKEIAVADACRMEHVISDTSFEAIKKHVKA